MRVTSLVVGIVFFVASAANAEFVGFDQEPLNNNQNGELLNSDIALINARLGACSVASETGIGTLAAGGSDADFYQFTAPVGCVVTAIVTPLSPTFTGPAVKLSGGDGFGPVASAIGGPNNGFGPASNGAGIMWVSTGNPIVFNVTGATNPGYLADFNHGSVGAYQLTIATYPEPASLVLLGLGGLALIRRRK